jgi:hypothetical protein
VLKCIFWAAFDAASLYPSSTSPPLKETLVRRAASSIVLRAIVAAAAAVLTLGPTLAGSLSPSAPAASYLAYDHWCC